MEEAKAKKAKTGKNEASSSKKSEDTEDQSDDNGPQNRAAADDDSMMTPAVYGPYTMDDLTTTDLTDSEQVMVDGFQDSMSLLNKILGKVKLS